MQVKYKGLNDPKNMIFQVGPMRATMGQAMPGQAEYIGSLWDLWVPNQKPNEANDPVAHSRSLLHEITILPL